MRLRYALAIAAAAALLAPTPLVMAQTPAPVLKKMAPPLRGPIEVGYMYSAKREGDKIVTTCEWDNTRPTEVKYGENTSNEMCFGAMAMLNLTAQ